MATNSISIASFGAVADGVTDNHAAIQNALNYAAANHLSVYIPSGTYAYSGTLTDNGVAVSGTGTSSVLKALDGANESLILTGTGGSVSNLQMQGTGTTRLSTPWSDLIWAQNAQNYTIQNVFINGSDNGGIFNDASSGGLVINNTIQNTQADSITAVDGSYNITIQGNRIINSGDDGISVVSYTDAPVVHDITIQGNTVLYNWWGRGITVVGGNNVNIIGNHVEGGSAGVANIYIGAESGWNTMGVNNILVSGNTLMNGGGAPSGTGQGAITICDTQGSLYSLNNITLSGNQIVNPLNNAFQFVGNGRETVTATNNVVYSSNNLTSTGDPLASVSLSNNQVLPSSAYSTPLVPSGGGVGAANTIPTVTVGSGSDQLVLSISEDAYANGDGTSDTAGDAAFTVSIDGKQLAGTFFAKALNLTGAAQSFLFNGDWAPGAHTVAVKFLNDAWGGTTTTDRNLYVKDITYDGADTKLSASLMSNGTQNFSVTDSTAVPAAAIGGGSDTLVVKVSEDAYLGNAQFTVSVDGKQQGGTFTCTTLHSSGASQSFTFKGDFGSGNHTVAVNFLNDAYGGSASTDRNLYVNDVVYNGTDTGKTATLLSNGAATFAVSGGTTPSVAETADHGSLQQNLSQLGTYTVGSDKFVLTSGNVASVALGTGTAQLRFLGAQSIALTGGSGQTTVTADTGCNTFVAGAGNLDVTGGAGKDAYVFHSSSGGLTLEDFSVAKGDTLTLDKSLQGSMHQATDGVGGLMLTFGTTGHYVDIHGVASLPNTGVSWV